MANKKRPSAANGRLRFVWLEAFFPAVARFLRDEWLSILVTLLLALFMQWLEYRGLFAGANGPFFNGMLSDREAPSISHAIVVVEIDDEAYNKWFHRAPLENKPELVMSLVEKVTMAQPRVVGVDILTEAPAYNSEYKQRWQNIGHSKIVWAVNSDSDTRVARFFPWLLLGSRDEIVAKPGGVLGYQINELCQSPGEISWGIPVYSLDEDSTIRRFPRRIKLSPDVKTNCGSVRSWARLVAEEYCRTGGNCVDESSDEIYVSYRGAPVPTLNASDFFKLSDDGLKPDDKKAAAFQYFLKGKVVLIGASSKDIGFSDMHDTPVGRLPGVVVNAYAVRAEINASKWALHDVKQPWALLLDFVVGVVIVLIFYDPLFDAVNRLVPVDLKKNEFRWKIGVTFGFLAALCLLMQYGSYIIGFVGVGLGVLLHQIAEVFLINPQRREESH